MVYKNHHGEVYYGFVYLWYDTKQQMFVIGSHHGSIDDGYVTSTGGEWFKRAYKKRPATFKRRILTYNTELDCKKQTQLYEQWWLDLRPDIRNNTRYYNMKNLAAGGNGGAIKGMTKTPVVDTTNIIHSNMDNFAKKWTVKTPNGEVLIITGLKTFCDDNNLDWGNMSNVASGRNIHHKNWCCQPHGANDAWPISNQWKFISPYGDVIIVDNLSKFSRDYNIPTGIVDRISTGKKSKSFHGWTGCKTQTESAIPWRTDSLKDEKV